VVIMPGRDIEQKLSQATYVISELQRNSRPFGLALNGYYSGITSSREHKLKILEQLALCGDIHKPDIEALKINAQIIYI
jgi:hypothetical protein